jgi:ribosomal protein S18 acetylase RimI-like enzyme
VTSAPEVVFPHTEVRTREGRTLAARAYTYDDFGALVEMYKTFEPKRGAQGLPPPDLPRITHWLEELQHKSRSLLALDEKRVVAHAILCPISQVAAEFTIFVHQDFRNQDLGTELSRLTLQFACEMGFGEILLITELSNVPAMKLYRKLGFLTQSVDSGECEMKLEIKRARAEKPRAA